MGKKTCGCCNMEKNTTQFYKISTAPSGFSSICKVCVKEKYKTNLALTNTPSASMWLVLSELGVPFLADVWKQTELAMATAGQNTDIVMAYLRALEESGKVYRGFIDSDVMLDMLMDTKVDRETETEEIDLAEQKKIWGKFLDEDGKLDIEAYELLNSAFDDYTKDVFDMDTNLERRYRDLAKCDLRLRRANEAGDGGEISKAQDALNKQLNLLKMNDFHNSKQSEIDRHIERVIWTIENTKPAECEDLEKYKDFSGFGIKWNELLRPLQNLICNSREYPDIPKGEL